MHMTAYVVIYAFLKKAILNFWLQKKLILHLKFGYCQKEVINLKNRSRTNKKIDQKIFRRTATKTKAINLPNKIYRGGIRL